MLNRKKKKVFDAREHSHIPIISFQWSDAHGPAQGFHTWFHGNRVWKWSEESDCLVNEVGFLLYEDDKHLLLASRYDPDEYNGPAFAGIIKIPITWIRNRIKLGEIKWGKKP